MSTKLEWEKNPKTQQKPFTGEYVERELASPLTHSGDHYPAGTVVSAPEDFWETYPDLAVKPPTADEVEDLEAKVEAAAKRLAAAKKEKARVEAIEKKGGKPKAEEK